jgi:ribonuclease G
MSTEIFLNVAPREVRAALLEDGVVQEIHIERPSRRGLVGHLYKGRVSRVLPGMQAAFVEIGLERTAFLHASDIARPASAGSAPDAAALLDVRRLVSEGEDVLVQVIKDPIGTKGARLTTYVSLPSKYVVYMPQGSGVGVSSRINEEGERQRLKTLIASLVAEGAAGAYIVRTAAQGASDEGLREDMAYLQKLWLHVRARNLQALAGQIVHEELALPLRILRDELARGVPGAASRIELYTGTKPIFDLQAIDAEISHALDPKVVLKSGGHLMIDQTEALTAIDVNTGAYVGHRNLEETIYRTNLEAAGAIARQLRLRNLGGIIIIDFIDMHDEAHRRQVLATLERALAADRAATQLTSLSPLGVVEMTRKRTRESLEQLLCEPCRTCQGRGFNKSAQTVCYEIFREIVRQSRQLASRELLILAHQDVVDRLLEEEAAATAELESQVGRPIRFQGEALYGVDQYDVVLV